jgi:membrane-bound lytic murein transglycosylase F
MDKYNQIFKDACIKYFPGGEISWLQLKAQGIAESNLEPQAVSPCGARGIMQLMPATAEELGVKDPFDPEENIFAGTRYLRRMWDIFKKELMPDRWYFALGAYNAGPGNIIQAQKIAKQRGLVDYDWGAITCVLPVITGHHAAETINYVARVKRIYSDLTLSEYKK